MTDDVIRKLLARLDVADETDDADSVTRLLKLAVAINQWNYPCVCRIECGYSMQDSGCVGEIKLLLSDSKGLWEVLVRACDKGDLITFIDLQRVLAKARETELARICESFGYVYVPLRLLQEHGKNDKYPDWWA